MYVPIAGHAAERLFSCPPFNPPPSTPLHSTMPNLIKEKDDQEWTSPEQKVRLQSRQDNYMAVQERKVLPLWFNLEFTLYFSMFPMEPVIEEEKIMIGQSWSMEDKWLVDEKVSL